MKVQLGCVALAFLSMVPLTTAQASGAGTSTTTAAIQAKNAEAAAQVPRLVKFSGTLQNVNPDVTGNGVVAPEGASPTSVVGITFSLYSQQTGGAPLWSEVQNVEVDKTGNYTVQLGVTKPDGLPVELFTSSQAQWLEVRQEGQAEQPRIMLLSVPYALKAADAETFGGKPPSAYMPAPATGAGSAANASVVAGNAKDKPQPPVGGGGTANYVALWTSGTNLGSSVIYQSASHDIGIGTTSPSYPLTVDDNSSNTAVVVTQSGSGGIAIAGGATSSTGSSAGVAGSSASSTGIGVVGTATSTSGTGIGVTGVSDSTYGAGVLGQASKSSGTNYGVVGKSSSTSGTGVLGRATASTGDANGIEGTSSSSSGVGVRGEAESTTGNTFGVVGLAASPTGDGVYGEATSTTGLSVGVYGTSASTAGLGVVGTATAATGAAFGVKGTTDSSAGVGVYGVATSDSGQNYGVEGTTTSPNSISVLGKNTSDTGTAVGVYGFTNSTGGVGGYTVAVDASDTGTTVESHPVGLWGDTNQAGGIGVLGTTDDAIAVAGFSNAASIATGEFENDESTRIDSAVLVAHGTHFGGTCLMDVSGNLDCTGSKSAVVPVDGGTRKVALYAVEAPENWFEDIGSARLSNGSAAVHLEATFAQTVNSGVEYHVFLTPKGDCKGLYVTNETAEGFEVRELGGGTANIAFDYRIVARRKGYEDIRLADNTERFAAVVAAERKPAAHSSSNGQAGGSTHPGHPVSIAKGQVPSKAQN